MGFFHRHRGATPYLLLSPGMLWLALFFLIPIGYLVDQSLQSQTAFFGTHFTWQWSNYWDALHTYKRHSRLTTPTLIERSFDSSKTQAAFIGLIYNFSGKSAREPVLDYSN